MVGIAMKACHQKKIVRKEKLLQILRIPNTPQTTMDRKIRGKIIAKQLREYRIKVNKFMSCIIA